MTDINSMIESMPLQDCKAEIERQFSVMTSSANEMKKAVVASFFLQSALGILSGIDHTKFLDSLRNELQLLIDKGEDWQHNKNMFQEHLDKNREILAAFDGAENKIAQVSSDINKLIHDYDMVLRELCVEQSRKSIAEIEAELAKT